MLASLLLCAPVSVQAQEEEPNPAPTEGVAVEQSGGSSDRALADSATEGGTTAQGTGNFSHSPFHVSVSVREGYDDNVYTTNTNRVGSFYTNASVDMNYHFGSARTQVDLEAVAGGSYYYYRPFGQDYDINTGLTLSLEHHVTPRLVLSVNSYLTYQTEPDLNTGFGSNRRVGNYFYTADKFTLSYQWAPRFSTATSYTFGAINYDDAAVSTYEDRYEHTFGNEFRFLVLPTTTLVAEYRFQIVDFDVAPRDSTTHFILGGVDHTFNPRFNISVRAGAEFRDIDNFEERTSPYAEATLRYAAGTRTSIAWTNRYGLEEPDFAGSPSRTTYRTGLTVSYAITQRLTATGALFYEHDDNDGVLEPTFIEPAFTEDSVDIGIGLQYEINRTYAVLAGYSHSEVFSEVSLREYARNRYYIGLNVTF